MTAAFPTALGSDPMLPGGSCYGTEPSPDDDEGAVKWQILGCPVEGVTDFGSLLGAIRDRRHRIDTWDFERRLGLGVLWDWDDVRFRTEEGLLSMDRLDGAIHQGLVSDASYPHHASVPGPA